jgi:hypothetical protein
MRRPLRGALHRIGQFFRAASARVRPDEWSEIESILTPAQMGLYRQMARCDQRHCRDVMDALRAAGCHERSLMQAALLHDAAKSVTADGRAIGAGRPLRRLTVWHRSLAVLMQRHTPGWLARLADDGRGWKRPFALHVRHAQASASLAAQVGCTPEVVDLIQRHHERQPKDKQLALFQWADEQH